jgi:hypothetical protein
LPSWIAAGADGGGATDLRMSLIRMSGEDVESGRSTCGRRVRARLGDRLNSWYDRFALNGIRYSLEDRTCPFTESI